MSNAAKWCECPPETSARLVVDEAFCNVCDQPVRPKPDAATKRVFMTTHKIVLDADDEAQARDLYERLWNDGYRVHRETHRLVRVPDGEGMLTLEVERVPGT